MSNVNNRFKKDLDKFITEFDDDLIICRCEEVTKGEIRRAVHDGMYTLTEIRRYLRSGMGLCQGQTCQILVKGIVAKELGISPMDLEPVISRSPTRPIEMKVLGNEGKEAL
ncbi:(2Fe-2S)-binding protein [Anaerosacchariphilus polymeriproducens]|uniref:(2Fe-2S)-binding protein n=1 Tax=Anaerosacchariphilus polymeriproducens TaxID=1812858 RepID=A0A371AVU3_9FIRM|nr:(2Fe-2S)-binding protein [Anaerosacchariphilus polymeriproducens]RDU23688.1 (2Fe-2S)-binding protein [Anaerosacchariphilus polymeriproducens]